MYKQWEQWKDEIISQSWQNPGGHHCKQFTSIWISFQSKCHKKKLKNKTNKPKKKTPQYKTKTQDEKQISHIVHCNCSYSFKGQFKKTH